MIDEDFVSSWGGKQWQMPEKAEPKPKDRTESAISLAFEYTLAAVIGLLMLTPAILLLGVVLGMAYRLFWLTVGV